MNYNEHNDKDVILDSITEGVFTVDKDWKITSFNKAAEQITGIPRQQAIGKVCRDILRANVCETDCALKHTMDTGEEIINKPVYIVDAKGDRRAITISTALLRDKDGRIIGGVETFRDMSQLEQLRKEVKKQYSFDDIISKNHQIQEIFNIIPDIAKSDCTVLIEGDTGTGKELFARALHNLSPRKDKPFIAINCAALPDNLLESELFGYKAGAFTDAKKDKPGKFAAADGGTIFLDEIGDISQALQVKLLRVLQEKTYEPVGAVESVKADARVITATNKELAKSVDKGEFRQDLYYRINVVKLRLPPLRKRKEDIPLLVDHFINRFNSLYDKNICCVSDEVMGLLLKYDFPGNIRELENIIEHCFILCRSDVIEKKHLPDSLKQLSDEQLQIDSEQMTLQQAEEVMIRQALKRSFGNKTAAAKQLGINPSTLFRKLKKLGITD